MQIHFVCVWIYPFWYYWNDSEKSIPFGEESEDTNFKYSYCYWCDGGISVAFNYGVAQNDLETNKHKHLLTNYIFKCELTSNEIKFYVNNELNLEYIW